MPEGAEATEDAEVFEGGEGAEVTEGVVVPCEEGDTTTASTPTVGEEAAGAMGASKGATGVAAAAATAVGEAMAEAKAS